MLGVLDEATTKHTSSVGHILLQDKSVRPTALGRVNIEEPKSWFGIDIIRRELMCFVEMGIE
ncbi:hypothetical protein [Archaeoglobus sp. UBA230]|uniref:hypothetical protein n=1 Tax=Archaeoglobus sp. UBA230 TaxID=1915565 RepID=UPI0025BC965E|nr:hypothetical protein [Archaeoglobus sp. UBA230]